MCGIYLNGNELTPELTFMILSAQVSASKVHKDGFGYFFATKKEEAFFAKTQLAAEDSIRPRECYNTAQEEIKFLLTHTRKASSGKVTLPVNATEQEKKAHQQELMEMSHPFYNSVSVMQHNGTLVERAGVNVKMDSKFLAKKFDEALLNGKSVADSLRHAFSFFVSGLASLMFAVKENNVWIPYFYKGNKPLIRFIDKDTGITVIITSESFIKDEINAMNNLLGYNFEEVRIIHEGLYAWNQIEPLEKFSLVAAPITAYNTNVNNRNVTKAANIIYSKNVFNDFLQVIGKDTLYSTAMSMLTLFDRDEVIEMIELSDLDLVNFMTLVKDNKIDDAHNKLLPVK